MGLENDSNGHNFTFTPPPPLLTLTEREMIKAQLTTIIPLCATLVLHKQATKRPLLPPTVLFIGPPPTQTLVPTESAPPAGPGRFRLSKEGPDPVSYDSRLGTTGRRGWRNGDNKIVIALQLMHDIFDEYPVVAKAYDKNAPRKTRKEGVTMQARKRRGALLLILKFNEHSERLLKSAISTDSAGKRHRLDSGDAGDSSGYYSHVDLADLQPRAVV
ncbi:hypothetical protein H4582DRAFT_2073278 [Lactarius indigo]|nr:hypothetical protein H4582DRAFT_2073278 [Lactarius indigo]